MQYVVQKKKQAQGFYFVLPLGEKNHSYSKLAESSSLAMTQTNQCSTGLLKEVLLQLEGKKVTKCQPARLVSKVGDHFFFFQTRYCLVTLLISDCCGWGMIWDERTELICRQMCRGKFIQFIFSQIVTDYSKTSLTCLQITSNFDTLIRSTVNI